MTPPNESGTFLRTVVPPAALPADTVNTAPTKPVPRDRVAEWKTLHTARGEHLRRYDEARAGLESLTKELTPDERLALVRWLGALGD